jgi:hypothetical protein
MARKRIGPSTLEVHGPMISRSGTDPKEAPGRAGDVQATRSASGPPTSSPRNVAPVVAVVRTYT